MAKKTKFIFVTGGVVSGLGKGVTAASLGRLLKLRGLKVTAQKLDPYLNVDPGVMSPFQHGEVFVTEDGAETDLDIGHYERFIDENLTRFSNLTSGKIYYNVLSRERNGMYAGQTVQVIPHITNEIKKFIYSQAEIAKADVLITEIGGTTGDIESQSFLEAARQVALEKGRNNCLFIHVTLVPYLKASKEHKSKPTQHSVRELMATGIAPDIIVARADEPLDPDIVKKLSMFCTVAPDCVIENLTLSSLYEAPLALHEKGFDKVVCRKLGLKTPPPDLGEWTAMIERMQSRSSTVNIALCGKYVQMPDAYLSIIEALNHAGIECGVDVNIKWVGSDDINDANVAENLKGADAIIVPGGFGGKGIEGKVAICKYARENNVPFLGLCLGMQVAVMEFARNVAGIKDANSYEVNPKCKNPVICFLDEHHTVTQGSGTMRLGAYPCNIQAGSKLESIYEGERSIAERHRHRSEFNASYRERLEKAGLTVSAVSPDGRVVEAIELKDKDFYIAVQFHPEFKSRPNRAHPLFTSLIRAIK